MTAVWIYMAVWPLATAVLFLAGRHLGDGTLAVMDILVISVLAGAVWPLLLIGLFQLSSVTAYSTAETLLGAPGPDDLGRNVVVPLR